jgi:hypothetical protein
LTGALNIDREVNSAAAFNVALFMSDWYNCDYTAQCSLFHGETLPATGGVAITEKGYNFYFLANICSEMRIHT